MTTALAHNLTDLDMLWNKDAYPPIPFTAPTAPVPGPDFIAHAAQFGDTYTKSKKTVLSIGTNLNALYAMALCQPGFSMPLMVKNKQLLVTFVPGHRLADEHAAGPTSPCDVMVIGKMPGREEISALKNFVGPSGKLLLETVIRLSHDHKFPRDWYVTNLMKFGHPLPRQTGTLPAAWIKDCKPLLWQELRVVQPKYILCLGSEAAKELFGPRGNVSISVGKVFDFKIDLRNAVDDPPAEHTAKAMVCIHPAAVTRAPDLMPQFESSIKLFLALVRGENVGAAETGLEHVIVDNEQALAAEVDKAIIETQAGAAIAVDCEWHGEYPAEPGAWLRTIQFSHRPKYACCVVIRKQGGANAFQPSTDSALFHLKRLFISTPARPVRAVGQFHRADLPWLLHFGLDLREQFSIPVHGEQAAGDPGGGFDTGAAAHSVKETDDFKLEVQASRYVGAPRYDTALQEWKKTYCAQHKLKAKDLEGYGECPDEILHPYACYDADVTRRLFDVFNGTPNKPGLLDCDDKGNNCRQAFWISMRASPACAEMESNGLLVDMERADAARTAYSLAKASKIQELRELIRWPTFNHGSHFDCRELLFGPKYRGQDGRRVAPNDAILCNLTPVKPTSKKVKRSWEEIERSRDAALHTASSDKEVLGILSHQHPNKPAIKLLRDIKFLQTLLQNTLRAPVVDAQGLDKCDEAGNKVYDQGLLSFVCKDKRIRTHLFQTLETGRYASARPNLQNLSKRREADYKRMLGSNYIGPLRSIFVAPPGYVLIEADYIGAELACMAWLSGDAQMIDHVRRAQLPESDPNYYDIHSAITVAAFRLNCPANKAGLESVNSLHLRVAAKNVVFGYAYGRGAAAIQRQCKEEGVDITLQEAQQMINSLKSLYPMLPTYFAACRDRVEQPGWICNSFGRFRRFYPVADSMVQAEQERQAMNFPIQSLVADAMSRALDHLYYKRDEFGLHYRLVLQIHDAVLLECPIDEVDAVCTTVLPTCMSELVPIWPTNLDGIVFPNTTPQKLGIDIECMARWGEKLTKGQCREFGISERFGKAKG